MNTIEKIEKGFFKLNDFTTEQVSFILGVAKMSYNEGYQDHKNKITNSIENILYID